MRITVQHVMDAVKNLNRDKNDGSKGLSSNHIIYGTNRLYVILSLVMQAMIVHNYVPQEMLLSVTVSIPKDIRGGLTSNENYRGISLSSCLCKILDIIIINLSGDSLLSSDLQHAFKKGHSTIMCTFVVKETISQYIYQGSNVYSCLVDASKAFDKIHFEKLFSLLLEKNIPLHLEFQMVSDRVEYSLQFYLRFIWMCY